jgi:PPK2 family polyphosphate:nucleotide phosphotransferase
VRKAFHKQLSFLEQNLRHPSLQAKKYDEASDLWQARVNRNWRFYFLIQNDVYLITDIISHPKLVSYAAQSWRWCSGDPLGHTGSMDLIKRCIVKSGSKAHLKDRDPGDTFGVRRNDRAFEKRLDRLRELQQLLYAYRRFALLIVLQALDAGGKDGTIRHVMSGVNPQGCKVTSFKVPTSEERAHDFLWRVHKAVPECGDIGIFNRSHYEDVLVVRVHRTAPKDVWSKRYGQINDFEQMLAENGVRILKFFLHISKEEQKRRLQARITDPTRNWKISAADIEDRGHWDDYVKAYEDALRKCSTPAGPWYVIPADHKWLRNYLVAEIVVQALEEMKLKYPPPAIDVSKIQIV